MYEAELKKVFGEVSFIKRRKIVSPSILFTSSFFTFFTSNLALIFSVLKRHKSQSFLFVLYNNYAMRHFIEQADASKKYDLLYAETFYAIASLKDILKKLHTPLLLIEQNIEWLAFQRQARKLGVFFLRWLGVFDSASMSLEEVYFWKNVPLLGALSPVDREEIIKETNRNDVLLVENGVDLSWFSEKKRVMRVRTEVLFVGNLSYFQNVDSLRWLLDEIWPAVTRVKSGLTLRIVGRGADESLKEYVHSKGYTIDEGVDDIRDAFQHAMMLVAPIRAGSGTKYKVLEAMASHLPIITTDVGAEGLAVTSGTELLIANTADGIADTIVDLSDSEASLKQLGENGYDFVKERYDWGRIVGKFEDDLQKIL
jgi:glycosyltransferase involved in cell wall biosynthesis